MPEGMLVANGQGYALTGTERRSALGWPAGALAGLTDLVVVHRTEKSMAVDAAVGQALLFQPVLRRKHIPKTPFGTSPVRAGACGE